mgnify:CR=1 FL=1
MSRGVLSLVQRDIERYDKFETYEKKLERYEKKAK